jgi:DNA invertase Pin-like site-specific DNA recombinase
MNHTSIRVALYARVSTAKCEKCGKIRAEHDNHNHEFKGQDPEVQLRELREYVARRGWQVTDVYIDVGVSGAKASRPSLNRLMTDASRRRFDAVVVWRFDRFARSVSHLLRVLEQFQALGIDFVSLSFELTYTTPFATAGEEYATMVVLHFKLRFPTLWTLSTFSHGFQRCMLGRWNSVQLLKHLPAGC